MRITIVCKGGVKTGNGHINRTISFIEQSIKFVKFSVVAIIDENLKDLFIKIPNINFIHRERELNIVLKKNIYDTEKCIIDCPDLNLSNQQLLKNKYSEIISLSPIFNNYSIIDVLFSRFKNHSYPKHIKIFDGLKYSIFNKDCIKIKDQYYNQILEQEKLSIAISMGGVDAPNKTLSILKSLSTLNLNLIIWVFLGEGYSHSCEELININKSNFKHELIIVSSNSSMWSLLTNCSLSILCGGITFFEAIYAGLPSINIFEKRIHKSILDEDFKNTNNSIILGVLSQKNLLSLNKHVIYLCNNRNELKKMRENTKNTLDNKGPTRTIKKILELSTKK